MTPKILVSTKEYRLVQTDSNRLEVEEHTLDAMRQSSWVEAGCCNTANAPIFLSLFLALSQDLEDVTQELWEEKGKKKCPICASELEKQYEEKG